MGGPRKQKCMIKQLYADLVSLGFDGYYGYVAAFPQDWCEDYAPASTSHLILGDRRVSKATEIGFYDL